MNREGYLGLLCICLAIFTGITHAIEVEDDIEIQVVENGSSDSVVLDCPYSLAKEDGKGLVIKWLQKGNPIAVYQWILDRKPQAVGILEGRLDLEYEASDERFHLHRALRILDPTTELSGEYECSISTFADEKVLTRELIVYSRPNNIFVWVEDDGEDNLKVVCDVQGIFPEPEVRLNMMTKEDGDMVIPEGAQETTTTWSEGLYFTTMKVLMEKDLIEGPTYFVCDVTIPNTDVEVANTTYYQPEVHETAGAVVSGSEARSALAVMVGLAYLGLWRI